MKLKILCILLVVLISCKIPLVSETPVGNKYVLDNSMTVILKKDVSTDLVVFDLIVKTGTLTENINGISYLTSKSLLTGTYDKDREELVGFLENDGGNFKVIPSVQYNIIRVTVPSSAISTALKFFEEILSYSTFSEVEKEKKFILDEIKAKKDNPQVASDELLYSKLYSGTPYANPVEGTEESVSSITREDVISYFKKWYVPNNMILIVVGNFNDELIKTDFVKGLRPKKLDSVSLMFEDYLSSIYKEHKYTDLYYINIGFRTVPAVSKDYIKLKMLSGLLGQGPSSRLYEELRGKQGLAYRLETRNPTIKDTGLFNILILTKEMDKAIEEALKQVELVKNELVSSSELEEVKSRVKGYYAINHQKSYDKAEYLGLYELVGRGYTYDEQFVKDVDEVSSSDLQYAANKYLVDPVISVVGPINDVVIRKVGE